MIEEQPRKSPKKTIARLSHLRPKTRQLFRDNSELDDQLFGEDQSPVNQQQQDARQGEREFAQKQFQINSNKKNNFMLGRKSTFQSPSKLETLNLTELHQQLDDQNQKLSSLQPKNADLPPNPDRFVGAYGEGVVVKFDPQGSRLIASGLGGSLLALSYESSLGLDNLRARPLSPLDCRHLDDGADLEIVYFSFNGAGAKASALEFMGSSHSIPDYARPHERSVSFEHF